MIGLLSCAAASVRVSISRNIAASPASGLDAFFERTWLRGGGVALPAVQLGGYGDAQTRVGSTRTLWPIAMGERVEDVKLGASEAVTRYSVVNSGVLFGGADIAHSGEVRFTRLPAEAAGTGREAAEPPAVCELVWTVTFTPPGGRFVAFWQRFTELAIGAAADDLVAHVGRRKPEATMVVCVPLCADASEAWREWLRFVWVGGGALRLGPLLLPSPIALPGRTRLVFPPGLVERVLLANETQRMYVYAVLNPSFSVLYPCSEHAGTVRFEPAGGEGSAAEGGCVMNWVVRLRPQPLGGALVRRVTESVVCSLAANFAREMERSFCSDAARSEPPAGPRAAALAGVATGAAALARRASSPSDSDRRDTDTVAVGVAQLTSSSGTSGLSCTWLESGQSNA